MRWITLILFSVSLSSFAQRSDFKDINFKKADSLAYVYQHENLSNLPVLTHNLTANLTTDVEKFRSIYTWVSISIENDYSSYLTTKKKRKKLSENQEALIAWNANYTPKVFENLLKHKKTACTGYAYLIRELAALAGINSKIVDGYGKTATLTLNTKSIPNHSWNVVELNGKWYLCDATWSAGKIIKDNLGTRFDQQYFKGYFLAEPELFIRNHYPLDISMSLVAKPLSFEEFIEGPVIYKEAFSFSAIPVSPKNMYSIALKNESVSFKLHLKNTLKNNNIFLILSQGDKSSKVIPKVTQNQNEFILEHRFNTSGRYDVHIKIDDTIIATYVVRVKRK
jgi:hypothetical protein